MIALVCGGRLVGRVDPVFGSGTAAAINKASVERRFVFQKLDELHSEKKFSFLIAGNEGGAERLGIQWAANKAIPFNSYGRKHKRETTIERNVRMLGASKPALVIAFGGGQSTNALIGEAKRLGIEVLEFTLPS